jgi:hypothetical protein
MTPSGIAERQNKQENLRLLAAQRQLYSEEKKRTGIWYAFSLSIAISFLATSALPFLKPYEALLAFAVLVVTLVELSVLPKLRHPRIIAAIIQEQFDCDVLELEWNNALSDKPDPKEIREAVQRFKKRNNHENDRKEANKDALVGTEQSSKQRNPEEETENDWKGLKNWYENPTIKAAPIRVARIACIEENVNWDLGQRREWVQWVIGVTVLFVILFVGVGVQRDLLLEQYFSGYYLLLIPPIMAIRDHVERHIEAIKRLDHLRGVIDDLGQDALHERADAAEITQRTRYLQTEICHHRMEDVPVLDWFYNRLGKKYASARVDNVSSAQQ